MTEKPELSDGFMQFANEISEALSRTYLSSYESQFLWCLFRKTYGWNKRDDWVSISQVAEMTGIHMAHVSRTKKKLIARNIVTQTGNKLSFNKYYSQWLRLPKQVTPKKVTQTGNLPPAHLGNETPPIQVITPPPEQAYTKETSTKDILQKTEPESQKEVRDDETVEKQFREVVADAGWGDIHYLNKTLDQFHGLSKDNRERGMKKLRFLTTAYRSRSERTRKLAGKVYHEFCGLVNDKGHMEAALTDEEIKRRKDFALEENGKAYVEQEL